MGRAFYDYFKQLNSDFGTMELLEIPENSRIPMLEILKSHWLIWINILGCGFMPGNFQILEIKSSVL